MMKLIADSSSDRPAIAGAEVQYVPLVVSTDHVHFVDDETPVSYTHLTLPTKRIV